MRFVTVRDLRSRPRDVWQALRDSNELVITSNGKPVAILTPTSEEKLEESLAALRRARAVQAVSGLQQQSIRRGTARTTPRKVDQIIHRVRRERRP
jgi:prevent-host-death family protein